MNKPNNTMKKIKRLRRLLAFIALLGLLIGIPLVLYFARNTDTVEAGWWDELWNYRKRITIGNSGGAQTNKRVSITMDTSTLIADGKLQSDCDDIRFTDINGDLLEHRINNNSEIAVTQVSHGSRSSSGNSLTFSHTVTSGTDQALVVIYHGQDNGGVGQDVSSVTINGTSLDTENIEVDSTAGGRSHVTSIWTMVDPFDGLTIGNSYNIVVTLASGITDSHVAAAYTLTGVDQSTPVGITASNSASAATSMTVTTGTTSYANSFLLAGSLVRAAVNYPQLNPPGIFSYWEVARLDDTHIGGAGGYLKTNSPGIYSLSFSSMSGNSTDFNGAIVEIKPAASTTSCNTATSDVEVLLESIPAGGTDVFMYYNNARATSAETTLADPTKTIELHSDTSSVDSDGGGGSGNPYVFNYTISSPPANPLLAVVVHALNSQTGSDPFRFESVKYNGDLMHFRSRYHSYNSNRNLTTEVWVLPNPDTGSSYQVEAITSVTTNRFAGSAMTFENVQLNASSEWWNGGTTLDAASYTLTFSVLGQGRSAIGGAVETSNDANVFAVLTGTQHYAESTGTNDNLEISAAGGQRDISPATNTLVIGQSAGTSTHINAAGISLIPDQTFDEFTPTSGPTLQSEEKSPGPVLHWKLDETSDNQCTGGANDICDSTSNLNDGTYSATRASGSNCLLGGCYQFNGSTNAITLPTASDAFVDFAGSEAFSGSAWIYVTTMPTGSDKDAVIAKWDDNSNHAAYRLYVENDDSDSTGNLEVQIYDESASQAITATGTTDAIAQNTWYHVAFSFNGGTSGTAGDLKLYVNGAYQAQNSLNGSFAGLENLASDFTVADYDTNDSTSGNTAFTGYIDEVKMFAYARTAAQMQNDYLVGSSASGSNVVLGGGLTPMPTPIIHWKFDEGSGAVANNSGSNGSGDNGTIASGTWSLSGKFNKALTFTASTSVTDTITDPGNTNTLSLWVYPTTSAASKTLITAGKLATDASLRPTYGTCTGTALALNEWTHIVAVSGGAGSCALYQNGVSTSTNTTGVTFGTSINVGGSSFTGSIDEVKVYDDALSADQVKVDFNGDAAINLGSGVNERSALTDGDYQSSLAGYWPMDENTSTSVLDKSGNANNASGFTGALWFPGRFGSSLDFDGTDDVITITNSAAIDFDTGLASGVTFSGWLNADTAGEGTGGQVFYKGTNTWCRVDTLGTTDLDFECSLDLATTDATLNVADALTTNRWYHFALTYADDGDDEITLYINGANKGASADGVGGPATGDTNDLLLGGTTTNNFNGTLDEFKVFSGALSQSQVAHEYNRGLPIAWYRLDECVGTTINNASGNTALNGTLTIGATPTNTSAGNCVSNTNSQAWSNGSTGKISGSLFFDDADDYVTVSDNSELDLTSGLTLAAWVKTRANEADNVIISKGASYEMGVTATGALYWDGAGAQVDDGKTLVGSGTWHHVAVTNNDTTATFYVDGVQTSTAASGVDADNATTLYIGYDGTNFFDGLIDEVKIFGYVLSPSQVKQIILNGSARFE